MRGRIVFRQGIPKGDRVPRLESLLGTEALLRDLGALPRQGQ